MQPALGVCQFLARRGLPAVKSTEILLLNLQERLVVSLQGSAGRLKDLDDSL